MKEHRFTDENNYINDEGKYKILTGNVTHVTNFN